MKKILALLLVMMLVFSLAACGNDESPSGSDNPSTSNQEQTDNTDNSGNGDSTESNEGGNKTPEYEDDVYTAEEFLGVYGFKKEDITPNHLISFSDATMDGKKKPGEALSSGYIVITVDKEATTADDYNAWFDALYSAMTELSEDGKLYKNSMEDKAATPLSELREQSWWASMPGSSCSIITNIKEGTARLTLSYRYDIETGEYKIGITLSKLN